jgi:ABC-type transporter Mla maintaining outer membrane lipid asymmetry ATPase subunit MlaF
MGICAGQAFSVDTNRGTDTAESGDLEILKQAPELKFENISDSSDGYRSMNGLSFTAPAGHITVVMGERGSGKSQLVRYAIGTDTPDAGEVVIDGQPLSGLTAEERRALHDSVGVLRGGNRIRESELSESVTVVDNLVAQLRQNDDVTSDDDARSLARASLDHFDLADVADLRPDDLDSSQERRVAIAAALLSDPALVVLDDPGSGIDVNHLESMRHAIKSWHGRTGSTLLLTTHSIEVAKTVGQRLVVLRDGQVVAEGDSAELLAEVADLAAFEQKFGTTLGVREADPERLRRGLHLPSSRAVLTIAVLLMLCIIFGLLLVM